MQCQKYSRPLNTTYVKSFELEESNRVFIRSVTGFAFLLRNFSFCGFFTSLRTGKVYLSRIFNPIPIVILCWLS